MQIAPRSPRLTVFALTLVIASATRLDAGILSNAALAEQLGVSVATLPDRIDINTPFSLTVVAPERLAKYGITGLKVNDQVQIKLLETSKLSLVPIIKTQAVSTTTSIVTAPTTTTSTTIQQQLLVTFNTKGIITETQLVPLDTRPLIRR